MMKLLFFTISFFLLSLITRNEGLHDDDDGGRKLFVFGDSYADTGNNRKTKAMSWQPPYGLTFPGSPAGRFSDGRVLTDFLAKFVGVKSPMPYRWRKFVGVKRQRWGINFAYGGTGVFDTLVMDPNMTTQIDYLEQMIKDGFYNKFHLQSSVALVSVAGNDYGTYIARGGSNQDLESFIARLIKQLAVNLKRINKLGVRKIAVTALEPLGCLPQSAMKLSFKQCNETENLGVNFHNLLLQQAVAKLNNKSKDKTAFFILDLYTSFKSVFYKKGSSKFKTPLKPCCMGIISKEKNEYYCGSLDKNGTKLYTVCDNPESAFFWDTVHPSQAGWKAVYSALKSTLHQFNY